MNPLTQVKNLQKITAREAAAGISEDASWHAKYKESAYIFVGGLSYDLTEGDLLAVFAQYGEIVDVNLVRDKGTGKSKGFAFLAYQDQRSTILAVDNLNGATVVGRIVRVDHVANYKRKKEEDEEEEKRKREERGVCYAFQRGECNRGSACKFSHDEQRNANTGWGGKDCDSKWKHDEYEHAHNRGQQTRRRVTSRDGIQEGDERSRPSQSLGQLSKDYNQHKHLDARRTDKMEKDARWSKPDDKKVTENRLLDEDQQNDDGSRYVDTTASRKNDYKRDLGSGSRDTQERDDKMSKDASERDDGKKYRDIYKRDTHVRDDGRRSRDTHERDDGKRSRDTHERESGKTLRDTYERDVGQRLRDRYETDDDKMSRDTKEKHNGKRPRGNDRDEGRTLRDTNEIDDGKWTKHTDEREGGNQPRDTDDKEDRKRLRNSNVRDDGKGLGDANPRDNRKKQRDTNVSDGGKFPRETHERDDGKKVRDTNERDNGKRVRDTNERDDGGRSREINERDDGKWSRDHNSRDYSRRDYDRNVKASDRKEAKHHIR